MKLGKRHSLRTRISATTKKVLVVLEHELEITETDLKLLESLMTPLGQELTNAVTAINNLVKSNAVKDATIATDAAKITDLQSQLDVANQRDLANPLNDADTATAATTLGTVLGTLPPDVLPPPAPVAPPDPAAPPAA
jgi:hypothetical protein